MILPAHRQSPPANVWQARVRLRSPVEAYQTFERAGPESSSRAGNGWAKSWLWTGSAVRDESCIMWPLQQVAAGRTRPGEARQPVTRRGERPASEQRAAGERRRQRQHIHSLDQKHHQAQQNHTKKKSKNLTYKWDQRVNRPRQPRLRVSSGHGLVGQPRADRVAAQPQQLDVLVGAVVALEPRQQQRQPGWWVVDGWWMDGSVDGRMDGRMDSVCA